MDRIDGVVMTTILLIVIGVLSVLEGDVFNIKFLTVIGLITLIIAGLFINYLFYMFMLSNCSEDTDYVFILIFNAIFVLNPILLLYREFLQ